MTGRPPFTGTTTEALLAQHRSGPVPLDAVPGPLRPLVTAGMAKDPGDRPADAAAFVASLRTVAVDAYGPDWEQRGRSHLAEAALLLAALWPSGAAPAVQGSTVEQVNLPRSSQAPRAPQAPRESRHLWHLRHLWHEAHLGHLRRLRLAIAGTAAAVAVGAVAVVVVVTTGSSHSHPGTSAGGSPALVKATSASPSGPASPAAPEITSVRTYTQGVLVYFDIQYADPGHDAEGFGFVGVNGAGWAEENHPFTSPSYGIVGTDSISYPFNEGCGTAQQYDSYVQAWIYDTAGDRSKPVVIHLVCS